jgi:hypothetical protein
MHILRRIYSFLLESICKVVYPGLSPGYERICMRRQRYNYPMDRILIVSNDTTGVDGGVSYYRGRVLYLSKKNVSKDKSQALGSRTIYIWRASTVRKRRHRWIRHSNGVLMLLSVHSMWLHWRKGLEGYMSRLRMGGAVHHFLVVRFF